MFSKNNEREMIEIISLISVFGFDIYFKGRRGGLALVVWLFMFDIVTVFCFWVDIGDGEMVLLMGREGFGDDGRDICGY